MKCILLLFIFLVSSVFCFSYKKDSTILNLHPRLNWEKAEVSLALNIIASDSISSDNRNLTISDSGSTNLHSLIATLLDANISGSGEISVLSRELNTIKFRINESGNINTINVRPIL